MAAQQIAVQSYCFRGFRSNAEVAAKVKEIGLAALEPCGVHVDFADDAAHEAAIADYRAAGVTLVSCGVNAIRGDAGDAEGPFRFAQKAGLSLISGDVMPPASWDTFAAAERLAEQYDVNVALHNHGGQHWIGNAQMLEQVFRRTGPRIGLMLDTAWAIDAREDPVALVRRFGARLMGVHLKDFVYTREREPQDVVIGTGILDLPALIAALRRGGLRRRADHRVRRRRERPGAGAGRVRAGDSGSLERVAGAEGGPDGPYRAPVPPSAARAAASAGVSTSASPAGKLTVVRAAAWRVNRARAPRAPDSVPSSGKKRRANSAGTPRAPLA